VHFRGACEPLTKCTLIPAFSRSTGEEVQPAARHETAQKPRAGGRPLRKCEQSRVATRYPSSSVASPAQSSHSLVWCPAFIFLDKGRAVHHPEDKAPGLASNYMSTQTRVGCRREVVVVPHSALYEFW
jgi:hypothetical protein